MNLCSVISFEEFQRNPQYRAVVDEMHAMMGRGPHAMGRHCRTGHGRLRRAEIEGGKHLEYPWAVVHGDFQPGHRVLDAGCGRGILQYYLARKGCAVSGCDIDGFRSKRLLKAQRLLHRIGLAPRPDLTTRLRANARHFGVSIDYHIEPMQALTWPDETFDRVASISVLEHIQPAADQRAAIGQLARVLKRGGLLVLTLDYTERPIEGKSDIFGPADVARVIEWSGLTPVEKPGFDTGNWDEYLRRLADFFGIPSCRYSAFTLILKKPA
jgi:SAM-dependent methyltransferase